MIRKSVEGKLADVNECPVDEDFMTTFASHYEATKAFVSRKIGGIVCQFHRANAYFGSSAFIDLIHQLQLDITGADISFLCSFVI